MSIHDRLMLAPLTDIVCGLAPITENRRRLVPQAEGVVLEPGMGSGRNLPHYDPARVKRIIGVDPGRELLQIARRRAAKLPVEVEIHEQSAEELPLENHSVDTVLLTYTGCTIPDIRRALAEFRRVLKPEGRLLFCEHGRSPDPRVARLQDWLNPMWTRLAGGCNLNRDIESLLVEAGFAIEHVEHFHRPSRPRFLTWHAFGHARPR